MSTTVCLLANTLYYPKGGGHMWAYLNWALGLRALGCDVVWLESIGADVTTLSEDDVRPYVDDLRARLERYGLADSLGLCSWAGDAIPAPLMGGCADLARAAESDLLLSLAYNAVAPEVLARFRRTAVIDIDPGLTQVWMTEGQMVVGRYDRYFTIGESVGQSASRVPDDGLPWHYTPPPVYLPAWPVVQAGTAAAFTTVTHWGGDSVEFQGQSFGNSKRDGFLPFLDLPTRTSQLLELAVLLKGFGDSEPGMWRARGWRMCNAHEVSGTPWDYQAYVQASRGEFSCAKPAYVQLESGWVSDRTLCYLASGKPAVVQHTGPSRFLPEAAGIFRFRDVEEAARCLDAVADDYSNQCRLARALAEEHFDAGIVVRRVLERAL